MRTLFSEMGSARTPRKLRMAFLTAKNKTDFDIKALDTPKVEERGSELVDEEKMEKVRNRYVEKQIKKTKDRELMQKKMEVKRKGTVKQTLPKFLTYDNGSIFADF